MDLRAGQWNRLSTKELMLSNCVAEEELSRVPWTARRSNQSILKSTLNIHWKDWCWSYNTLATWCKDMTHWKRHWCWERLKAGGEGDNRGWDGWMASLTQWTWVWANFKRQWRAGKPGVLHSSGSQRVRSKLATEQQHQILHKAKIDVFVFMGHRLL